LRWRGEGPRKKKKETGPGVDFRVQKALSAKTVEKKNPLTDQTKKFPHKPETHLDPKEVIGVGGEEVCGKKKKSLQFPRRKDFTAGISKLIQWAAARDIHATGKKATTQRTTFLPEREAVKPVQCGQRLNFPGGEGQKKEGGLRRRGMGKRGPPTHINATPPASFGQELSKKDCSPPEVIDMQEGKRPFSLHQKPGRSPLAWATKKAARCLERKKAAAGRK